MRLLGGTALLMGLVIAFVLSMLCMIAEAADLDPNHPHVKALLNCGGDLDCQNAYDRIYGEGSTKILDDAVERCTTMKLGGACDGSYDGCDEYQKLREQIERNVDPKYLMPQP